MAGPRRRNVVGAFPAGSLDTLGEATAGGTVNLDLDAQEAGADTLAAAVTVLVQLSLAAQESGADTLAADVDVLVQTALTAQEAGPDAMAGTASVLVQATLQAQEGSDTAALAASVLVQADMAAQDEPDTFTASVTDGSAPPAPAPAPSGGGSWGSTSRPFVHYAREYPEDERTPVAEAVAEAAEPRADDEAPAPARRRRQPLTVFAPPQPSAEELLLAQVLVFEQTQVLLAAQIQADLLGIQALREAAAAREEEEAIELFLLLEA